MFEGLFFSVTNWLQPFYCATLYFSNNNSTFCGCNPFCLPVLCVCLCFSYSALHMKYLCVVLFLVWLIIGFFFLCLRYEGIVLFVCAYLDPQSCYICSGQPNALICMILLKWWKIKTLTARALFLFFFYQTVKDLSSKNAFPLCP